MFAVVQTGGKQYKVKSGDRINVELLPAEKGSQVVIDEVLFIQNKGKTLVGSPLVSGASVTATLLDQRKTRTMLVFKKRRRKHYRRKNGHRQQYSVLRIDEIKS